MQPPDGNGAPMGMPGANSEAANHEPVIDKNTMFTAITCLVLLLLALLFVVKFKRRGR